LDEAGGAGRVAPQKLTITATVVQTVLPYNEADENGEQDCFYPVPRFRRRNDTAKIKPVNGLRVEIFRALCGKYYPSIDRLDSRNEDICSKALQMFCE